MRTQTRPFEDRLAEFIRTILHNKYIPQEPTDKQALFLLHNDVPELLYGGAAGGGKAQPIETPVLTPFGWKPIGDLKVDDMVCNPDGTVAKVIIAHPVQVQPKYTITFHDGTQTCCGPDHIWKIWRSRRSRKIGNQRTFGEDSAELMTAEGLKHTLEVAQRTGIGYPLIPVTTEVAFNVTQRYRVEIEPYFLGLLLGDGHIGEDAIGLTSNEHEDIETYLDSIGADYNPLKKQGTTALTYQFRGAFREQLKADLKRLGLLGKKSGTKFIPRLFMYGTVENRYALVQGMMDTDGYVDGRGQVYFCTTSKQMADDFAEVLRSLGAVISVWEKEPKCNGVVCATAYELYIKHRNPERLFRLKRKRDRAATGPDDLMFRKVVSVEIGEPCEMRCITVSNPNGLYLTNDYIVTHNSSALLMAALQFVHVPGYSALLLRKTYTDLALPGALMDRAQDWLGNTDAKWDAVNKIWRFPSGASITFGYLEGPKDKLRYQSAEFSFIGLDEVTQFDEASYSYLFSRLRKTTNIDVPLRMRSASNPPALLIDEKKIKVAGEWVKERFITATHVVGGVKFKDDYTRGFVSATLEDNPYLDHDAYIASLNKLDPITRQQLRYGDWDIRPEGGMFKEPWFKFVDYIPAMASRVRFWDLASTEGRGDWTAGFLVGLYDGEVYLEDLRTIRGSPQQVEQLVRATAEADGRGIPIIIEQEPGSAGANTIDYYRRHVLLGWPFTGIKPTGNKVERAQPLASMAEAGHVKILRGEWNREFIDEAVTFPFSEHDDKIDAAAGGFNFLTTAPIASRVIVYESPYRISEY